MSRLRLPKVLAVAVTLALGASGAAAIAATRHDPSRRSPVGVAAGLAPTPGAGQGWAASSHGATGPSGSPITAPDVRAPASGVPVSDGPNPSPNDLAAPGSRGPITRLPAPTVQTLPHIAPLAHVNPADAVILLNGPLTPSQLTRVQKLKGVTAVEQVDTGTVQVGGASTVAFGVDPATFREFTPAASAASDRLWQYLAGGSLVSSYEMASDRALKLGSEQPLAPASSNRQSVQGWLGAFASIGLPGVDLLVSHTYSNVLGLTPNSGLVVSAPQVPGGTLQSELQHVVPGSAIELLHAEQLPDNLPGDVLTSHQRDQLIAAALSRVGAPYVWGGAGPDVFDCSGLVQWAYRQAGIGMPRTAAEQFLTGDHIPLADAEPGDLLFWTYDPNDPGFVDHTAIYLGNGLMVVAPHTGLDVEVVPVPTSNFAGAVAVVLAH